MKLTKTVEINNTQITAIKELIVHCTFFENTDLCGEEFLPMDSPSREMLLKELLTSIQTVH